MTMKPKKLISDYDLMLFMKQCSEENNVRFTPVECAFAVSFIRYMHEHGSYDRDMGLHYVQLSFRKMAALFDSSTNLISSALQKLEACGLISRSRLQKDCIPDDKGSYKTNRPYVTYMDLTKYYCS